MLSLDLLGYKDQLRLRTHDGKKQIFDQVRKKWLVLLPEELVRQLLVLHLITELNYPASLMRLEMGLEVNENYRRCDVLACDRQAQPFLLAECKAPDININEKTLRQIVAYNYSIKAPFLLLSNGRTTYCMGLNEEQKKWNILSEIPPFPVRTDARKPGPE